MTVREIFDEWRTAGRELYAAVFDEQGMRSCAGVIAALDDAEAIISGSQNDLCIPYATAGDTAVTTLDDSTRSVTLTWRDGTSAFLVARPAS